MARPDGEVPAMTGWSVYVLVCADGSYYTGVTNNLTRRLDQHRAGRASRYTRGRLPVRLAWTKGSWPTRGPALKLEARIKAMTRRQKKALLDYAPERSRATSAMSVTPSRPPAASMMAVARGGSRTDAV
jgi:predicted GIY-YIG superfamily endonuclease